MNLIIDIGNTRTKLGIFGKERLLRKEIFEKKWKLKELKVFLENKNIQNVALSTVGVLDSYVESFLKRAFYFLQLDSSTPVPIQNAYKTPKTLGKDRLAAVVGAAHLFPGQNCLVIDAGTCITYDFINREGVYQGGSITPGIILRLKAMNAFTESLPLVERKPLKTDLGKDTISSLRTGAQLGAVHEVSGFIEQYKKQNIQLNVILTGGDGKYFANQLKTKIFVNPNLVLVGLNKILNYNVQNLE